MKMIEFYKDSKKVAEIDISGWTIRQVVNLIKAAKLNGRQCFFTYRRLWSIKAD